MKPLILPLIVWSAVLRAAAQPFQQHVAGSANEICPIKIGSALPRLNLQTINGDSFDLNAAIIQKPTVLIFYRGGWCPYCNRQLSQIRRIHPQLTSMGYQLIAVSADRPEKLVETVQKDSLKYMLLSDSKTFAAQTLGLAFKVDESTVERYRKNNMDMEEASGESHHILPVPAVFVIGTDGIIKFEYVNPDYRVRVDAEVLLAAARSALLEKPAKP